MRYICTSIVATLLLAGTTLSETWTVDDDGPADFDNIQDAVSAATYYDEIIVHPGTYTSSANTVVNTEGKALTLRSAEGPASTIIDGEGQRRPIVCNSNEPPTTVIQGFTITGGTEGGWDNGGGGILVTYESNLTVIDCIISGNAATNGSGGGICVTGSSSVTLTNCQISGNTSTSAGAGLGLGSGAATLINCSIISNVATGKGGGIWTGSGHLTLQDCDIQSNSGNLGGGIFMSYSSGSTITNSTISNNVSGLGGGIYFGEWGGLQIQGTTICANMPDQIYGSWDDQGGNYVSETCGVTGACCQGTSCDLATEEHCLAAGGLYQGDNTKCEWDTCEPPLGACCTNNDVVCVITTLDDCTLFGHVWMGGETSCEQCTPPTPVGACCIGTACISITLELCFEAAGSYAGDNVTCQAASCPGACLGDVNEDQTVGVDDVLTVISNWGPCP